MPLPKNLLPALTSRLKILANLDIAERFAPQDGKSSYIELDMERLSTMGIITPNASNSALAEQHRIIKRPLLDRASRAEEKGQLKEARDYLKRYVDIIPTDVDALARHAQLRDKTTKAIMSSMTAAAMIS